jgi:hypothetical protein
MWRSAITSSQNPDSPLGYRGFCSQEFLDGRDGRFAHRTTCLEKHHTEWWPEVEARSLLSQASSVTYFTSDTLFEQLNASKDPC